MGERTTEKNIGASLHRRTHWLAQGGHAVGCDECLRCRVVRHNDGIAAGDGERIVAQSVRHSCEETALRKRVSW